MNNKTYCVISGNLKFRSALHIGSGRGEIGTDAPLRRNERGEIILPGTALGGVLRTTATYIAPHLNFKESQQKTCLALSRQQNNNKKPKVCGCPVCHLFGEIHPSEEQEGEIGGRASRLWVYDAQLVQSSDPFIRDRVGIDRATGSAARAVHAKFDQEVIPVGADFSIQMELEDATEEDQILLAAVLAEWEAGRVWLGAGKGRGLGNAILSQVHCSKNLLENSKELLDYLKLTSRSNSTKEEIGWLAEYTSQARNIAVPGKRPFVEVEFLLEMESLFLTQDSTASGMLGFDHVTLLDGVPGSAHNLKLLLPGSGVRGALRSHAERIARTIASINAYQKDRPLESFKNSCPACNPLQNNADLPLAQCSKLNGLEINQEPDPKNLCLACQLFGNTQQGSRLRVMDAPLEGDPVWKTIDFLAIDRFTGGGLDGAKFDAAALWQPKFNAHLFLEEPQDWQLGWLSLILRDLAEGYISFGFGAAKGFGQAKGTGFTVCCGFLGDEWGSLTANNEVKDAPGFYRLAQFTEKDWETSHKLVKGWIQAFSEEVNNFSREPGKLNPLAADNYFKEVEELYPIIRQEDRHE